MAQVHWQNLLPAEFLQRLEERPVVYLPLGICEPHGHAAPFGLDTLKADWICTEAARRCGGIVAPTLGYQIHEAGFHAPWLEEVVGEINPRMTAMPPEVMLRFFLYQLRAFAGAGFRAVFAVTGHAGGNQDDFRLVAAAFTAATGIPVVMKADPELAGDRFPGDHAGKYELSQLLYLHPELMVMDRLGRAATDPLGRFAQNPDAHEATAEYGEEIMRACLAELEALLHKTTPAPAPTPLLSYAETEAIWTQVLARRGEWITEKPYADQPPVSAGSQWKPFEFVQ